MPIGGAVSKMLENTENQEGEPLARCSTSHKINRGADSKMLENIPNPEGESLARCSKT